MAKPTNTTTLKCPEDFFTSPKESKMMEEAKRQITGSESDVLDQDQLREQEDWSHLANKVVGAEDS